MSSETFPEKITQLQCHQTNIQIQSQFLQWINDSFKYKPKLLEYIQDEIEALLGYAQYKLTIAQDQAQPGDALENIQFMQEILRFRPLSKKTKILWLVLSVLLPYFLKKLKNYAEKQQSFFWKTVENGLIKVQKVMTILSFINYAVFILKGQYRTIVQRILRISMKFISEDNKRVLDFSLMNRVLVWKVYEFFLKTVLPHAFAFVLGPMKNLFYLSSFLGADSEKQTKDCIFCSNPNPTMPYQIVPCEHKACYYCHLSNPSEKCVRCSTTIQEWISLVK